MFSYMKQRPGFYKEVVALATRAQPFIRMFAQAATPSSGLNPEQRHRADALISIFENGTPKIQYGYAENIRDGRGITAGRAGFTTATGDALEDRKSVV